MRARAVAAGGAGGAGGGVGEAGFDVVLYLEVRSGDGHLVGGMLWSCLGDSGPCEEEDAEQGEKDAPWVDGVDDGGEGRYEEAEGGEGYARPGAVYYEGNGRDGDVGAHCGAEWEWQGLWVRSLFRISHNICSWHIALILKFEYPCAIIGHADSLLLIIPSSSSYLLGFRIFLL